MYCFHDWELLQSNGTQKDFEKWAVETQLYELCYNFKTIDNFELQEIFNNKIASNKLVQIYDKIRLFWINVRYGLIRRSSQDLNDSKYKKYLYHGKAWYWFDFIKSSNIPVFGDEWVVPGRQPFIKLSIGGEDDFVFGFGCILFSVYFQSDGVIPKRILKFLLGEDYYNNERTTEISFFENCIMIYIWHTDYCAYESGFHKVIDLDRLISGKTNIKDRTLLHNYAVIDMPEKEYKSFIKIIERTVTKSRLPFWKKIKIFADVDLREPIPMPGKGENDYDMDDDALYGGSYNVTTVEYAIEKVKESVNKTRLKYGGKDWYKKLIKDS